MITVVRSRDTEPSARAGGTFTATSEPRFPGEADLLDILP